MGMGVCIYECVCVSGCVCMNVRYSVAECRGPWVGEKTGRCPLVSWEVKEGRGMRSPGGRGGGSGGREAKAQGGPEAGKWSLPHPG